jgi:hypothetical protein
VACGSSTAANFAHSAIEALPSRRYFDCVFLWTESCSRVLVGSRHAVPVLMEAPASAHTLVHPLFIASAEF